MSTHSRPTPETDALIHKINADMDAAEAAGTELSADVPMREMIDHARRLEQQRDECVEALGTVMQMIDSGQLVRDTSNDGDSGWHMRMMWFVSRLQCAAATLARIREDKP